MPKGGFIAPGNYQNDIETDRNLIRAITSARSGALLGFTISPHASLLRMTVDAGAGVVAAATADARRGSYFAWSDVAEDVIFTAPDATNSRIDALVLAFGDSQYGSLGSGIVDGPQWITVDGTPAGSPVAPSDSDINTAVGAGSWVRWADVQIDPGNTTIQAGNITDYAPSAVNPLTLLEYVDLAPDSTPATGWSITTLTGVRFADGHLLFINFRITRTGSTLTGSAVGNVTDTLMATLPAGWTPTQQPAYCVYSAGGTTFGNASFSTDGSLRVQTLHATGTIDNGTVVAGSIAIATDN